MHLAGLVAVLFAVAGQENPSQEQIGKSIEKLSSESIREREEASEQFLEWSHRALPALKESANGDDPEASGRARDILAKLAYANAPKLAFTYGVGTTYNIRILRIDTKQIETITEGESYCWAPSWSPDGRYLAFARRRHHKRDRTSEIWIYDLATQGRIRATTVGNSGSPKWSPDGRAILYSRYNGSKTALCRMRPDGTNAERLTEWGKVQEGYWCPDGKRISYLAWREKSLCLLTMVVTTKKKRLLAKDVALYTDPSWSPDGRRLAFVSKHGLHIVNARTGEVYQIEERKQDQVLRGPRFTPDGGQITCVYSVNGAHVMGVWSLEGVRQRTFRLAGFHAFQVVWGPRGNMFFYEAYENSRFPYAPKSGHFGLFSQAFDGSDAVLLTDGSASAGNSTLFPGRAQR